MIDYPEETEGTRMAAEVRKRCNNLSREERDKLFARGMVMIYGGKRIIRKDQLLKLAAEYIRKYTDCENVIFYDGTDCDGECLATDCEAASED